MTNTRFFIRVCAGLSTTLLCGGLAEVDLEQKVVARFGDKAHEKKIKEPNYEARCSLIHPIFS